MLICAMRDDFLDMMDILSKGDISKESYDDIIALCLICSRGSSKMRMGVRDVYARIHKSANGGITRAQIGHLLESFKTNLMSISAQMDSLQIEQKKCEVEKSLAFFFSRCKQKHPPRESPLNSVEICSLCENEHPTQICPSLPELKEMKVVIQAPDEEFNSTYFIASKIPSRYCPQGMNVDPYPSLNNWNSNVYNHRQIP